MQRSFSSFVEARLQKWASQEIIEHMEHVKCETAKQPKLQYIVYLSYL
jgi:hypothetical protein